MELDKTFLQNSEKILGIVNITPDSFSGDGLFKKENKLSKLLDFAGRNNISNLDIGCASSKPGYENVATQDELNRLNYFLSNVKGNFSLSIDTSNPIVAELALKNNFKILNDINGFEDEELIAKAIEYQCNVIIVHRHPESKHLHEKMNYRNNLKEVLEHLEHNVSQLIDKGINKQNIFIDPGLGFGKFEQDSVDLLMNIKDLVDEIPVVVGYSRKKFTQKVEMNNKEIFEHCINSGVTFVRLHLTN